MSARTRVIVDIATPTVDKIQALATLNGTTAAQQIEQALLLYVFIQAQRAQGKKILTHVPGGAFNEIVDG